MRIILFIDNLSSGGAQRQITYLANLFQEHGHMVELVHYGDTSFYYVEPSIRIIKIKTRLKISRIYKFSQILNTEKPDVVISFLDTPNLIANICSIFRKKWILITSERNAIKESFLGLKNRLIKRMERFSDKIVCNSKTAADLWSLHFPAFSSKICVIYNGVPPFSDFANIPPYEIRKNNKTSIIIVGSFKDAKNPLGFLNAVASIDKQVLNRLEFRWFGSQVETNSKSDIYLDFMKKIELFSLQDYVLVFPPSQEIHKEIQKADFLALFSKFEGLPNVVLEAMALSKPIIMTRISDYNILVTDKNGFLCDWFNEISMMEAILRAESLPNNDIIAMGKESKRIVFENFGLERYYSQWFYLIKTLAKKGIGLREDED